MGTCGGTVTAAGAARELNTAPVRTSRSRTRFSVGALQSQGLASMVTAPPL